MAGEWVKAADVRAEVPPEVYRAMVEMEKRGFRFRREGHKFRAYCPCGPGGSRVRIDGTPQNPSGHARRILRQAAHCPNRHELDG